MRWVLLTIVLAGCYESHSIDEEGEDPAVPGPECVAARDHCGTWVAKDRRALEADPCWSLSGDTWQEESGCAGHVVSWTEVE